MIEDELKKQMKGTPIEELGEKADRLRNLKKHPAHKDLVEYANDQMGKLLFAFILEDDANLVELRAQFRSWYNLLGSIDEPIQQYDIWLSQTLDNLERKAAQASKGF